MNIFTIPNICSAAIVLALAYSATGHASEAPKPLQMAAYEPGAKVNWTDKPVSLGKVEPVTTRNCDPRSGERSLVFCDSSLTTGTRFEPQASLGTAIVVPRATELAETPADPNEKIACFLKQGGKGGRVWSKPGCEAAYQARLNPPKAAVTAQAPAPVQVAAVDPTPVVADLRPSIEAPVAPAPYVAPAPALVRREARQAPPSAYTAPAYNYAEPVQPQPSSPTSMWYGNLGLGGATIGNTDQFLVGADLGKVYLLNDNLAGIVRAGAGINVGDNGDTLRYEGSLQGGFATTLGKGFTPYGLIGVRGITGPKVSTYGPTGTVGLELGSIFTEYGYTYYLQAPVPGGSQHAHLFRAGITSPLDWRWGWSN
ncbi:MAG TPA: hypothetical protein VHP58_05185 [Alphaproteobacteria bacterium]|nr:hypothetical protein [Alphaproteobacteria bacterium]